MWHTIFIALHTIAATVALLAGLVALPAGRLFGLYRWTLAGMVVFLVPALVIDWAEFDGSVKVIFAALLVLAAAMFYRATLASRMLPATTGGPTEAYLNHVGFTLIALFDGFAVVAVLRAGAPAWLVAVTAVGIPVIGHFALRATRVRLVRSPERVGVSAS
ncbi:MAG: hypothetical protein ACRDS9_23405 [Pseudonocardiaceae bacterium]